MWQTEIQIDWIRNNLVLLVALKCQRWGRKSETRTRFAILGLATCLRLACNDLRLDLRLDLKDLRLDLGLEAWWLATCTSAHFIHRSKTKPSMNPLINNSEHLLLIMHSTKSFNFVRASSSTAMERLLTHDFNAHDWPTKHCAIRLQEWIANFHWFSWLFVSDLLMFSSVFVCLLFCKH